MIMPLQYGRLKMPPLLLVLMLLRVLRVLLSVLLLHVPQLLLEGATSGCTPHVLGMTN
jgi:hypothetical protein